MLDGSRHVQAVHVTIQRIVGNTPRISIHPTECGGLEASRKPGNLAGQPSTGHGLVERNQMPAEVAERVGRGKEDQTSNSVGVPGGQHHRHSTAVRMPGNICTLEPERVHTRRHPVRCSFQSAIGPRNSVGLAHIEQVERIDARMLGEKSYVLPPVSGRTNQTMEQKQGRARACALIMQVRSANGDVSLIDFG